MLSLFENKNPMTIKRFGDTHLDTCHRIWQQDKANYNIKIPLYHWLLIYVHMSKPTSGLRPCDINCSKFFPAPFWSHNQKVVWVSLLYLHTKSNADCLPINSTLILSQSLGSDHETTRLRYQGLWAPTNIRQPLCSHHGPVRGSSCTLVQTILPVSILVHSYRYLPVIY